MLVYIKDAVDGEKKKIKVTLQGNSEANPDCGTLKKNNWVSSVLQELGGGGQGWREKTAGNGFDQD